MAEKVTIEKKVLSENDRLAAEIRSTLENLGVFCINMVSSPGSGKTSILERTLAHFGESIPTALIAGDVQTENDADRLKKAGGKTVRAIETGGACHLDAKMVKRVLDDIDLQDIRLLFIENVGNLVCPASFDLGEDLKVVLMSTTEGDDKPLKYPSMFRRSSVMIINKCDLLGLSNFDKEKARENALTINGKMKIIEVSCRTGEGLEEWYDWLESSVAQKKR